MARLPSLYGDEERNPIDALLGIGRPQLMQAPSRQPPQVQPPQGQPDQGTTYRPWVQQARERDMRVGRSDDEDFAEWFSKAPARERARWAASEIVALNDPSNDVEEEPSLRQQFGEAFAISLRPELGPMIRQRQLDRRTKQEVARKQRLSAIDMLMGLPDEKEEEPYDPRILNVPGVGVYQVPRGGFPADQTPAPIIPFPQEQKPVDYENVPGVPGYVRQPGSTQARRLGGIPEQVFAQGEIDRLPAQVIIEGLRNGINPYPADHPLYGMATQIGAALKAQPEEWMQRLRANILLDALKARSSTRLGKEIPIEQAWPLAQADADRIMQSIGSGGAPGAAPQPGAVPPPGAGRTIDPALRAQIQARGDALAAQGLSEQQVAARLRQEFPQAFPE